MRIKLVSFADGSFAYRLARRRFLRNAKSSGFFSEIVVHSKKSLLTEINTATFSYQDFLRRENQGFGFWAWKPLLIHYELGKSRDEFDVLLYADIGCSFNKTIASSKRLEMYSEIAQSSGVMTFHLPGFVENQWSKRDAIDFFGLDAADISSDQRLAGILMFGKSKIATSAVMDWLTASQHDDFDLLRNAPTEGEIEEFRVHRHDQSLWSLASKKHNLASIPDETYFAPNWNISGENYPIWATRLVGFANLQNQRSIIQKFLTRLSKLIP